MSRTVGRRARPTVRDMALPVRSAPPAVSGGAHRSVCHRVDVERELRELEEAMWRPETRGDRRWMEAHLSDGFVEFGQSGRRYGRSDILEQDVGHFTAVLRDLTTRRLGTNHVLVTYRSEMNGTRANRSSIWERTESGWLMDFHQGTPTSSDDS